MNSTTLRTTDVIGFYSGSCGTCHTTWSVTLRAATGKNMPDHFEVECPVPWCGMVELVRLEPYVALA